MNTNVEVIGLIRLGIEPQVYRSRSRRSIPLGHLIDHVVNNQHRPSRSGCMSSACRFTFYNLSTGTNIIIACTQTYKIIIQTVETADFVSLPNDDQGRIKAGAAAPGPHPNIGPPLH